MHNGNANLYNPNDKGIQVELIKGDNNDLKNSLLSNGSSKNEEVKIQSSFVIGGENNSPNSRISPYQLPIDPNNLGSDFHKPQTLVGKIGVAFRRRIESHIL